MGEAPVQHAVLTRSYIVQFGTHLIVGAVFLLQKRDGKNRLSLYQICQIINCLVLLFGQLCKLSSPTP